MSYFKANAIILSLFTSFVLSATLHVYAQEPPLADVISLFEEVNPGNPNVTREVINLGGTMAVVSPKYKYFWAYAGKGFTFELTSELTAEIEKVLGLTQSRALTARASLEGGAIIKPAKKKRKKKRRKNRNKRKPKKSERTLVVIQQGSSEIDLYSGGFFIEDPVLGPVVRFADMTQGAALFRMRLMDDRLGHLHTYQEDELRNPQGYGVLGNLGDDRLLEAGLMHYQPERSEIEGEDTRTHYFFASRYDYSAILVIHTVFDDGQTSLRLFKADGSLEAVDAIQGLIDSTLSGKQFLTNS